MKCSCGQYLQSGYSFCPKCGTKVLTPYASPVGTWHVTTEGDVEGRTIKDLGVHTGHVVDIARALGGSSYYSLKFEPILVSENVPEPQECKSVSVQMGIDSNTWNMTVEDRVHWMEGFLTTAASKSPVMVTPGQYYASVVLKF